MYLYYFKKKIRMTCSVYQKYKQLKKTVEKLTAQHS